MSPEQEQALAAIAKVRSRLTPDTRDVLDRLLRGEEPHDDDPDTVEQQCTEVWIESGRRRTTTKRLAAHEALEQYLQGDYSRATEKAEFAKLTRRTGTPALGCVRPPSDAVGGER